LDRRSQWVIYDLLRVGTVRLRLQL
jgi:hypothetical protein